MSNFSASISDSPLDPAEIHDFVLDDANGALVSFEGIVRNHDSDRPVLSLDYRAHPEAERFIRECCERVAASTGFRVAASHRVGHLGIGDVALVASVAAPHRAEAFAACAELVEEIKRSVPIWKRQHFADGISEWVGL